MTPYTDEDYERLVTSARHAHGIRLDGAFSVGDRVRIPSHDNAKGLVIRPKDTDGEYYVIYFPYPYPDQTATETAYFAEESLRPAEIPNSSPGPHAQTKRKIKL